MESREGSRMNPILNVLSDGPTPYGELISLGLDPGYVDTHLRVLRKAGKIRLDPTGFYCLPVKQPKDRPLPVDNRPTHPCKVCGVGVVSKRAIYCSMDCLRIGKTKPKPDCIRCGMPCRETEHKYCGRECFYASKGER
jgi:hypothetical protein